MKPANGQRGAAVGIDFDRHLVVGAAHAAGLDLKQRLAVLDRLLEELERVVAAALLFEVLHRLVEDALGGRLLAAPHHRVHKLGDQRRPVDRIRRHFPLRNVPFSWHKSSKSAFAAFSARFFRSVSASCLRKRIESFRSLRCGKRHLKPQIPVHRCRKRFLLLLGWRAALGALGSVLRPALQRLATPTESSVPRTT